MNGIVNPVMSRNLWPLENKSVEANCLSHVQVQIKEIRIDIKMCSTYKSLRMVTVEVVT